MTEKCVIDCISLLKLNFSGYNYSSQSEFMSNVKLWMAAFANNTDEEVTDAVMNIIKTSEIRPFIATIKKEIVNKSVPERDDAEVWSLVIKAVRNDPLYAREEWSALPDDVRSVVSPDMLVEIGRSNEASNQFLRKEILNNYHSRIGSKKKKLMTASQDQDLLGTQAAAHYLLTGKEGK